MGSIDETTDELLVLQGYAEIWKHIFSFANSMALKCAVELGIPDILHSQNRPLSLPEIASRIPNASSPNIHHLSRIMRLLVHNNIFTSTASPNPAGDPPSVTRYGLTPASRWLVRDGNELSLSPVVLMINSPWLLSPWHQLSACVREGGVGFPKAHGCGIYDLAAKEPELKKLLYDAMVCAGNITVKKMLSGMKKDVWEGLESVVDVGGGTGHAVAEIVKSFPHIKGINFDLLHVIQTAPEHAGVTHVAGDMFVAIPNAQAIFMKWMLHNWDDENSVKILKNCRKAVPEGTGKIFIVEMVLKPDGDEVFGGTGLAHDLQMIAQINGMERTESDWEILLEKGGFSDCKFTKIPDLYSIIEASAKIN